MFPPRWSVRGKAFLYFWERYKLTALPHGLLGQFDGKTFFEQLGTGDMTVVECKEKLIHEAKCHWMKGVEKRIMKLDVGKEFVLLLPEKHKLTISRIVKDNVIPFNARIEFQTENDPSYYKRVPEVRMQVSHHATGGKRWYTYVLRSSMD